MKRRIELTIFAALLGIACAASAGQGGDQPGVYAEWRSIGPAPPAVEAEILSDPASRTLYLGSNGGGRPQEHRWRGKLCADEPGPRFAQRLPRWPWYPTSRICCMPPRSMASITVSMAARTGPVPKTSARR